MTDEVIDKLVKIKNIYKISSTNTLDWRNEFLKFTSKRP